MNPLDVGMAENPNNPDYAEEVPVHFKPRLYPVGTVEAVYPMFDWALRRFQFDNELPSGDELFWCPEIREYRLGRYLLTPEQLTSQSLGKILGDKRPDDPRPYKGAPLEFAMDNGYDLLGEIKGIGFPLDDRPGYWIVEQNGKVDVFLGQIGRRPVMVIS
jgi:hypothetical protein